MKIVEIGIEVLESNKNRDLYFIEVYDVEAFRKNFMSYYKRLNPEECKNNIDYLIKNGKKNPEEFFIDSYLEVGKKSIDKKSFDGLLKLTRKDKIKRLKLI